jgi:hypothetical protein
MCYYLVKHIENVLRSLQLFYFHLWPIYWLSLVAEKAYLNKPENYHNKPITCSIWCSHNGEKQIPRQIPG